MKKWVIEDKKENYRKIIQENQISNFLAIILGNRGIIKKEEIEIFLNPSMEKTHSPFLMKDLEKGCNLLIESAANRAARCSLARSIRSSRAWIDL